MKDRIAGVIEHARDLFEANFYSRNIKRLVTKAASANMHVVH